MATKTYVYNPAPNTKGVATAANTNHNGYGSLVARIIQRFDTSKAQSNKNKKSEIQIQMELRNRSNEYGLNSSLTTPNGSSSQTGTLKVIDHLNNNAVIYNTSFTYTIPAGQNIPSGSTWGGVLHTMPWKTINHNDDGTSDITVEISATWNNWIGGSGTEYGSKRFQDLKPTRMRIGFNANGGSGAPDSVYHYYGVATTIPSTIPTRPGYKFLGWSTRSNSPAATFTQNNKNINFNGSYIKKGKRNIQNSYTEFLINSTSASMKIPYWSSINGQDDLSSPWPSMASGSWSDSSGAGNTYNFGYGISALDFDSTHIPIDLYGNEHFQNQNVHLYAYNSSGSSVEVKNFAVYDIPFAAGSTFNFFPGNDITLYANWERIPCYIKVNGVWKEGIPYVKVNGAWKEGISSIKVDNTWK